MSLWVPLAKSICSLLAELLHTNCLISGSTTASDYHPLIFDGLDGTVIHEAALLTSGAAGPSGVDFYGWRHQFALILVQLLKSCAVLLLFLARRLCPSFIDPIIISPLVACRLIALHGQESRCPPNWCWQGGQVYQCQGCFYLLSDLIFDQCAVGPIQLCAGKMSGMEAAIHSMRASFSNYHTDCAQLYSSYSEIA